jgi:signal transduction histidine kinase
MRDMRLLIFQLHPPELETEGLAAVLQARLAAVEARAGLQTDFRVEGERRLPIAVEEELYWIAQEALNNVLKHARARRVTVGLHFADASICLEVRDDGVGFDALATSTRGRGGVGLRSISERAVRVGGTLSYESRPGEGTRVKVEVNL